MTAKEARDLSFYRTNKEIEDAAAIRKQFYAAIVVPNRLVDKYVEYYTENGFYVNPIELENGETGLEITW